MSILEVIHSKAPSGALLVLFFTCILNSDKLIDGLVTLTQFGFQTYDRTIITMFLHEFLTKSYKTTVSSQ